MRWEPNPTDQQTRRSDGRRAAKIVIGLLLLVVVIVTVGDLWAAMPGWIWVPAGHRREFAAGAAVLVALAVILLHPKG